MVRNNIKTFWGIGPVSLISHSKKKKKTLFFPSLSAKCGARGRPNPQQTFFTRRRFSSFFMPKTSAIHPTNLSQKSLHLEKEKKRTELQLETKIVAQIWERKKTNQILGFAEFCFLKFRKLTECTQYTVLPWAFPIFFPFHGKIGGAPRRTHIPNRATHTDNSLDWQKTYTERPGNTAYQLVFSSLFPRWAPPHFSSAILLFFTTVNTTQ